MASRKSQSTPSSFAIEQSPFVVPQQQTVDSSRAPPPLPRTKSAQTGRCKPVENDVSAAIMLSHITGNSPVHANRHLDGKNLMAELMAEGFTFGLASTLMSQAQRFTLRIWLIDNSGSMNKADGHRIAKTVGNGSEKIKSVDCTRWEEVTDTVMWHAQLSATMNVPIVFRLLNDPGRTHRQQFSIGEHGDEKLKEEVKAVEHTMRRTRPNGKSCITQHLKELHASLTSTKETLHAEQKLVAITIVTDGLPTDEMRMESEFANQEFVDTLLMFRDLPVMIVIRLSTDEERVVQFYNTMDEHFSSVFDGSNVNVTTTTLDVLDDYVSEANEVYKCNPWLNYTLPLHLCRESGMTLGLFDALDERPLTRNEIGNLCRILFHVGVDLPDPVEHWSHFLSLLRKLLRHEKNHWNPILKRKMPWIHVRKLKRMYGSRNGCTVVTAARGRERDRLPCFLL